MGKTSDVLDSAYGYKGAPTVKEVLFTEDGAGTYTGTVSLPAGAILLDILIIADALWAAATSASLVVGDADDADGFFTAVDLKATDLLAGESIDFSKGGGVEGAYLAGTGTHWTNRRDADERDIVGVVTSVGAGTTGRTRMVVVYLEASEVADAVQT